MKSTPNVIIVGAGGLAAAVAHKAHQFRRELADITIAISTMATMRGGYE